MKQFLSELKSFPQKCDWVLLLLCLITSGFGMICMLSATNAEKFGGSVRYVLVQSAGIVLGLILFAIVSSLDAEIMSELIRGWKEQGYVFRSLEELTEKRPAST